MNRKTGDISIHAQGRAEGTIHQIRELAKLHVKSLICYCLTMRLWHNKYMKSIHISLQNMFELKYSDL